MLSRARNSLQLNMLLDFHVMTSVCVCVCNVWLLLLLSFLQKEQFGGFDSKL